MLKPNLKGKIYSLLGVGLFLIMLVLFLSHRVYTQFHVSHEHWKQYIQQEVAISKSLAVLNKNMGYGGFSHNLKNLKISRDLNIYQDVIERNIFDVNEQFGILEGLVTAEKDLVAIQQLDLIFSEYTQKYEIAKKMVLDNKTTSEIDEIVKLSNIEAQEAMNALSSSINRRAKEIEKNILNQNNDAFNSIQLARVIIFGFIGILIFLLMKYIKREYKNNIQLQIEKEKADLANTAKTQFLSCMSHELRTPLNAILGFSQLLEYDAKDAQTKENIQEITNAGEHLLELISQLLELSKIESGIVDFSIESYELNKLLNDSLSIVKAVADEHSITIDNKVDSSLDVRINVDKGRFKQILLNLLSNAIKYNSENGKVTIDSSFNENNMFCLSISDKGKGLTPEQKNHLFKAFDRAGAENSDIQGTGLGLVITKDLVEKMHGTIGFESEINKGTRFWIQFPIT